MLSEPKINDDDKTVPTKQLPVSKKKTLQPNKFWLKFFSLLVQDNEQHIVFQ